MKKCLKCGHVRTNSDPAPEGECPSCGVIYAKAERALQRKKARARQTAQQEEAAEEKPVPASDPPPPVCPKCKKPIDAKPAKCPHCGALTNDPAASCLIIILFIIGSAFLISLFGGEEDPASLSKEERIDRQFGGWDGSHIKLTEHIKKSMNDPDSYQHVKTLYWEYDNHIVVKVTYRGKNAFGGVVKNTVRAKCDLDGNIIEIMYSGP